MKCQEPPKNLITTKNFVDDEGTKCVKQMILCSRNVDYIYPEIDTDLVAGSELGINSGMCRCSYIAQVSIFRWHGIVLGSMVFVRATNEQKYT